MRHPKFLALSGNAIALWHEGKDYCDDHHTDGLIPATAVKGFRFRGTKSVDLLTVSCGQKGDGADYAPLWEAHPVGYRMHDYLDHNPCRDELVAHMAVADAKREKDRERLKQWREKRVSETPEKRVSETKMSPAQKRREEKRKEEKEPVSASAEPHGDSTPAVMEFLVVGDPAHPTWLLQQSRIDNLSEAYPNLDVVAQCRKARVWAEENPPKRKTARGMPAFLFKWMDRATNSGGVRSVFDASGAAARGLTGARPQPVTGCRYGHQPPCLTASECTQKMLALARAAEAS